MSEYKDVSIGELFLPRGGKARYIKDYVDNNPGVHPVLSASLARPFGHIDSFDYEGDFLTWVMNGYGGRVRSATGKFSVNRDRGVFEPRPGIVIPDLSYLQHVMEPQLTAAAVGRRVDGRLNEYTKLYPDEAAEVSISLPWAGETFDFARMRQIGERLRRISLAQEAVAATRESLARVTFPLQVAAPRATFSLGNANNFALTIGKRVLTKDHASGGIPVYSANAREPFGHVEQSNLADFESPSLLWGIDGNFDWNYLSAGQVFATTDHCGRLQVLNELIDPFYVYCFLRSSRGQHGFDRVYRASLGNLKSAVSVLVPLDEAQKPDLGRQRELAASYQHLVSTRASALSSLNLVKDARLQFQM